MSAASAVLGFSGSSLCSALTSFISASVSMGAAASFVYSKMSTSLQGAILQYFAMRRADMTQCEIFVYTQVTLSTNLVWPVCLVCRSCCVLFLQGLPQSSHTMLRTCAAPHSIACAHYMHHQSCHTLHAFC